MTCSSRERRRGGGWRAVAVEAGRGGYRAGEEGLGAHVRSVGNTLCACVHVVKARVLWMSSCLALLHVGLRLPLNGFSIARTV